MEMEIACAVMKSIPDAMQSTPLFVGAWAGLTQEDGQHRDCLFSILLYCSTPTFSAFNSCRLFHLEKIEGFGSPLFPSAIEYTCQ